MRHASMSTNHEVRYWTQTLDFTEQQLRSAVAAAGVEVKKIRTYVRLRWRSVGLLGSEGGRCKSVRFGSNANPLVVATSLGAGLHAG